MPTDATPSRRVLEQRLRNRAIEALEQLAEGADGVRVMGTSEWVNIFFDAIDDQAPWDWRSWSVFTPDEVSAIAVVHDLLVTACDATPGVDDTEPFIATGWPDRIRPVASEAVDLVMRRGRFDEDVEEAEPTANRPGSTSAD